MAAELPQPGTEVIQVFRTVSPTVITPTLIPCVVGACKQVVNVVVPSAAGGNQLNPQALISESAFFIANAGPYTTLDGILFIFSVNNSPNITVTFAGTSLSATAVVAQINAELESAGVTEAFAETFGTNQFVLRTVGTGEFQSIEISTLSGAAALTAFGLIGGHSYVGWSTYSQYKEVVPLFHFPDPNNNLDQITIEPSTVRLFLAMGSGVDIREFSRTTSHLKKGGGGSSATVLGTAALGSLTYGGGGTLDGLSLTVTIDGGTPVVIALGTPVSITHLLQTINVALGGMYATNDTGLRLTSLTKGTSSSVLVATGTAATALGFTTANNSNTGTAGVVVVDDGNGDSLSPLVQFVGQDFTASPTGGTTQGVVDLTTLTLPGDLTGRTLTLAFGGNKPQTYTFDATSTSPALVASNLQAYFPDSTVTLSSNFLVLTSTKTGEEGTVKVIDGTAMVTLGLVPYVTGSIDLANIVPDFTVLNTRKFKISTSSGSAEVTFSGLVGSVPGDIVTFLNAQPAFSALAVAVLATGNRLRVYSKTGGLIGNNTPAFITISPASSLEAAQYLGFSIGQTSTFYRFEGVSFKPLSGDDLYVDGTLVGRITQVAPGAVVTRLKVNKQLMITTDFGDYYTITAKNLSASSLTRPTPELIVDGSGVPTAKHDVIRDTNGNVLFSQAPMYLSYRALRKDVTAKATNPGLLRLGSTSEVESIIPPLSVDNPLALGFYFALINAPGVVVSGLGVDEVSADAPEGTVEAFTRAAEYLEAFEVYAIAPMTHDETVGQVFNTHVLAMSEPANKGERIVVLNHSMPTKKVDTLVASGLNGNSASAVQFDTGVVNLPALLLNKGINPVGTIPVSAGVFLDIASDSKRYSVSNVSGSVVTIRTSFLAGENDDAFYATTDLNDPPLPSVLINEPFGVRIRGASLVLPDNSPDRQGIAETYQLQALSIASRRVIHIVPDQFRATIGGLDQLIPGYYAAATKIGMISAQPPQQSFTNFPVTGLTGVVGSNDFFTTKQLNIIAAGGNDIFIQEGANTPVFSRFALTADTTSIETRTDSITRIVDFTAKFMRRGLKTYIGRFNITQGFLDSLGNVTQGLFAFLINTGVLIGANLNNLIQDENAPDAVIADAILDVPYPCNYIRLTLVI